MTNLHILIVIAAIILIGMRFVLWYIDYYYDGEEGYELECEQESENRSSNTN